MRGSVIIDFNGDQFTVAQGEVPEDATLAQAVALLAEAMQEAAAEMLRQAADAERGGP